MILHDLSSFGGGHVDVLLSICQPIGFLIPAYYMSVALILQKSG